MEQDLPRARTPGQYFVLVDKILGARSQVSCARQEREKGSVAERIAQEKVEARREPIDLALWRLMFDGGDQLPSGGAPALGRPRDGSWGASPDGGPCC